jgi:hypothetical protein
MITPYFLSFVVAILAFAIGWFASLRFGRPPLALASPTPIDALANNVTTQIGYLHDDVLTLHRAVETWSEHSTAAIGALRTDVIARQEELGVRLTAVEVRTVSLEASVAKLTMELDHMSTWEPGKDLQHPAQLLRFMNQSSQDRAGIRDLLAKLQKWFVWFAVGAVVYVVVSAPLLVFVAARVFYNWFLVGAP